jgi:hypothetical protein
MLRQTRDLLLMYLGIGIGLVVFGLYLFFVLDQGMPWEVKAFILALAGVSLSIFVYFHRPK